MVEKVDTLSAVLLIASAAYAGYVLVRCLAFAAEAWEAYQIDRKFQAIIGPEWDGWLNS